MSAKFQIHNLLFILTLSFVFLLGTTAKGQVLTFDIAEATTTCGSTSVMVDVSTSQFTQVNAFQYSIGWDASKLTFKSVSTPSGAITGLVNNLYNDSTLNLQWTYFGNINGLTLPNGTQVFRLEFNLKPGFSGTTPLIFKSSPGQTIELTQNLQILSSNQYSLLAGAVTVTDNTAPSLTCPANVTVSGNGGATVNNIAPQATGDNCSTPIVGYSLTGASQGTGTGDASGYFFQPGTTTVTYTVTDGVGNTNSCAFQVTVNGTNQGNRIFRVKPDATFNCATQQLQINFRVEGFDSLNAMQFAVFWDTTRLSYLRDTNFLPAAGNLIQTGNLLGVSWFNANQAGMPQGISVSDNTRIFTMVFSLKNGLPALPLVTFGGTALVPVQVVKGNTPLLPGQYEFQTGTLKVLDAVKPQFTTCPGNISLPTPTGQCSASANWTVPTATDNCDQQLTLTSTHQPGALFNTGTTTVTYTATDDAGNTATCSFTVTVNDLTAPTIQCPADVTVDTDLNTCTANGRAAWVPTATDNCPGNLTYTWSVSGATTVSGTGTDLAGVAFNLGLNTVRFTVRDAAGNTAFCIFRVTVRDQVKPVLTCPADISTNTAVFPVILNGLTPVFTDNCGVPNLSFTLSGATTATGSGSANGQSFNVGTTTVTYTATDASGNSSTCSFKVVVVQVSSDLIECPVNQSVFNGTVCNVAVPGAAVTLKVPQNTLTQLSYSLSGATTGSGNGQATNVPFAVGTTTVTYTARDNNGIVETCSFTVTVADSTKPVFTTCPANRKVQIMGCDTTITWAAAIATDNCLVSSLNSNIASGSVFSPGITTVTYTAVDPSGNSNTCSFTVEVEDMQKPLFANCDLKQLKFTDLGNCEVRADWEDPDVNLACGNLNYSYSIQPGSTLNVGQAYTVTVTVTDANGSSAQCSTSIIAPDKVAPVFTNCDTIRVRTDGVVLDGQALVESAVRLSNCGNGISLDFLFPKATDDCSSIKVAQTLGQASGTTFNAGSTSRLQFTATDGSGNSTSCPVLVIVEPVTLNAVAGPDDEICEGGTVSLTANSNAGINNLLWTGPNGFSSSLQNPSVIVNAQTAGTYTLSITDASGCTVTDQVTLKLLPAPALAATSNSPVCKGGLQLAANLPAGVSGNASWTGPNGFTGTGLNLTVPNANQFGSGTYYLQVTTTDGCVIRDTLDIKVQQLSSPSLVSSCTDLLCVGEACTLLGTQFATGVDTYEWNVMPANGLGLTVNTNQHTAEVLPTAAGVYTVRYWVTKDGCSSDTAVYNLNVLGLPVLQADTFKIIYNNNLNNFSVTANDGLIAAGSPRVSIVAGKSVQNGALTKNQDGTFTYIPSDGFIGTDGFTYEVCYDQCADACAQVQVLLLVEADPDEPCRVPNVITPNGDNFNDALVINCLYTGNFPSNELIIVNEWGDRVFQTENYQNNWDGTWNGKPLPDGTYYYFFKPDRAGKTLSGFISILR